MSAQLNYLPQFSYEENEREKIDSRILEFSEKVVRGCTLRSNEISKEDVELYDILYEFIEDNMEKFLPEPDYDI